MFGFILSVVANIFLETDVRAEGLQTISYLRSSLKKKNKKKKTIENNTSFNF
jgi:hypothetical protein